MIQEHALENQHEPHRLLYLSNFQDPRCFEIYCTCHKSDKSTNFNLSKATSSSSQEYPGNIHNIHHRGAIPRAKRQFDEKTDSPTLGNENYLSQRAMESCCLDNKISLFRNNQPTSNFSSKQLRCWKMKVLWFTSRLTFVCPFSMWSMYGKTMPYLP